jgi:hypothetical protein
MGKGQVSRGLAITIVSALCVVGPLAAVAAAGEAGGSGDTEVLATLTVDADNVSVQKAGKDQFKPAKNGQKLREGDTVKTDATGKAEIDYSDDAYTRLDVNTTFTITKLTEEQGERQVEGSLEEGRTWNRTAAVTESGSFEQSGGGATAAVTGTAFPVDCTIAAPDCLFTGVEGTFILRGNGEDRTVTPFQQCGSTDGDLCDEVRTLTADEMAAILWIQENLLEDLIERGLGTGPIVPGPVGTVVVENGQVIEFVEIPTSLPPSTPPEDDTPPDDDTPPTPDPPTVDGVTIINNAADPVPGGPETPPEFDADVVASQDEVSDVTFVIRVTNPDGGIYYLVFTDLPAPEFGEIWDTLGTPGTGDDELVNLIDQYPSDTVFRFDPVEVEPVCDPSPAEFSDCFTNGNPSQGPDASAGTVPYPSDTPVVDNGDGTVSWFDSFTVVAVDDDTGTESTPTEVPLEVVDDICATPSEGPRDADEVVDGCDVIA